MKIQIEIPMLTTEQLLVTRDELSEDLLTAKVLHLNLSSVPEAMRTFNQRETLGKLLAEINSLSLQIMEIDDTLRKRCATYY